MNKEQYHRISNWFTEDVELINVDLEEKTVSFSRTDITGSGFIFNYEENRTMAHWHCPYIPLNIETEEDKVAKAICVASGEDEKWFENYKGIAKAAIKSMSSDG